MHKLPYNTLENDLFKELHSSMITVNTIFTIKVVIILKGCQEKDVYSFEVLQVSLCLLRCRIFVINGPVT